jgi:hypothetical protein
VITCKHCRGEVAERIDDEQTRRAKHKKLFGDLKAYRPADHAFAFMVDGTNKDPRTGRTTERGRTVLVCLVGQHGKI